MIKRLQRIFFIIVLFVLFQTSGVSQSFEGGLMGGLLGSQVAGDVSSGYNKLGLYFGGFARRQFTLKSGAQLEIYYIQKGAQENPTEKNGETQYLLRIQYIEIPVLYQFKINDKLDLSTGLAYSYFVGDSYEEYNYSISVSATEFNQHSATFILGIEVKITDQLSASFRTNNSITPIRAHVSEATRLFNRGQYSDALTFGLTYNFFNPNTQ